MRYYNKYVVSSRNDALTYVEKFLEEEGFVLKKYKEHGIPLVSEEKEERMLITP